MLELKDVSGSALIEFFNEIFSKDKLTGFISAENPEAGISSKIFLEKGQITYATSTMYRARFGDLMIKKGIITPKELNNALKIQKEDPEKPLIGNILVNMGVISERVIPNLLYHQIEVVIYEIISWKHANLSFEEYNIEEHPEYKRPVSKIDTKTPFNDLSKLLDSQSFIENLSSNVKELIKIRDVLNNPDEVPKRSTKSYPAQLTFDQRKILRAIDGINSINDIIILSDLDYFRTYQIIYNLSQENIISVASLKNDIITEENVDVIQNQEVEKIVIPEPQEHENVVLANKVPVPVEKVIDRSSESPVSGAIISDYEAIIRDYKDQIKNLNRKIEQMEESTSLFSEEITKRINSLNYPKKVLLTGIIKNILDMS